MGGRGQKRTRKPSQKQTHQLKKTKSSTGIVAPSSIDSSTSEISVSSSEEQINSNPEVEAEQTKSPSNQAKMEKDDFLQMLLENIGEILSTKGAQEAIKNATGETLKDLSDRQTNLEEKQGETDKAIGDLKRENSVLHSKIDSMEQASRNKTLRISGLDEAEHENTTDSVINMVKEKLKIEVKKKDIAACFRIGKLKADQPENERTPANPSSNSRPILLILENEAMKKDIYRARLRLNKKNNKDQAKSFIFINEDLTSRRAQLSQQARGAVKRGDIHSSWTLDGNIYIKTSGTSPAKKISILPNPKPHGPATKEEATAGSSTSTNTQWAF